MTIASAADLCAFIDRSPTPFHVCETVSSELADAGYVRLAEPDAWPTEPGRYFVVRGGSLVAWSSESSTSPADGFRVVGGHTDSPNLRLKQHHDLSPEGLGVVALEPYGGPLLQTWLDRDLGVAGRLALRDGREVLVHVDEPVLRVPNLAIHLSDRKTVDLDPQRHLNGLWSTSRGTFLDLVAERAGVAAADVLGLFGFGLFVEAVAGSTIFNVLPLWLAAPLVGVALFGWAVWQDPTGLRVLILLVAVAVLTGLFGRSDTPHWTLLIAPLVLPGFIFAADGIRDLLGTALDRRRITVTRVTR